MPGMRALGRRPWLQACLGGLARAGLPDNDENLVLLDGLQQLLPVLEHGQVLARHLNLLKLRFGGCHARLAFPLLLRLSVQVLLAGHIR